MFKLTLKRSFALLMCVVMLISCWVFAAPSASAAEPKTKYSYSLSVETTNSCNQEGGTTQTIKLYGKGVNGTGADEVIFDDSSVDSSYFDSKKTYTKSGSSALFPTKVEITIHTQWTAAISRKWEGTIKVSANSTEVMNTSMALEGGAWGNYTKTDTRSVDSGNYPKVNSVQFTSSPPSSITIPRTDETNKSYDIEAVVLDQYGVVWYEAPNYALVPNHDGVELANGKLTIKSNANTADGTDFKFDVAASSGTKSASSSVTLSNAKYTYTFKNEAGETISTSSIKYGLTPPKPANQTKASDEHYHYSFADWSPAVKALTKDTVYTPQFSSEEHIFLNYISDNNATCTQDGTMTATCTCGYTDTITEPDTVLGHTYTSEITTPPTCTEEGVKTFTCIRGDHSYTVPVPATGHDYEAIDVPATCTEQGYTDHVCTVCQDSYQTDYTPALGHTYDTGTVATEPTCTEDGVMRYKCIRCDDAYTEPIEKLGHDYKGWSIVEYPTCTEDGSKVSECNRCPAFITEVIPATGHSWSDWTVESVQSCTTDGRRYRTCSNCPEVQEEVETAYGHDMVLKHEDPDDGITGCIYFQCSHCKLINACEVNAQGEPECVVSETSVSLAEIQEESVIPATSFNTYVREDETEYSYVDRGAALKVDESMDEFTQPMRFTASMLLPENVTVLDFGYIYTREDKLNNLRDFVIGGPFVYDFSFKNGNSTDHVTDEGIVKTFNIVIRVDQNNWDKTYVARPYITYSYAGITFTVYDQCYADNSVDNIAEAVMYSDEESDYVKEYVQNKIINR